MDIPSYIPPELRDKYKEVVAEFEAPRNSHMFWLNKEWLDRYESIRSKDNDSLEFAMMLSSVRKAVANFVYIMTGKSIPVRFSTGQVSYATKDNAITLSASSDPKYLDSAVGTSMHEAAHILLSQYRPDQPESIDLFKWMSLINVTTILPLVGYASKIGRSGFETSDLQMIINVLEDRRIDDWVYEKVRGYRVYYDARWAHKWKSPLISRALHHPMGRRPLYKCYEMHFINMINPLASPDLLPGLDEIWEEVDLPHIRRYGRDGIRSWDSDHQPLIIKSAIKILEIMYRSSINPAELITDPSSVGDDDDFPIADVGETGEEMPPQNNETQRTKVVMDHGNSTPVPKGSKDSDNSGDPTFDKNFDPVKYDQQIDYEVQSQKNIVSNDDNKDCITPSLETKIDMVEEGDAIVTSVGTGDHKTDVLVFQHMTTKLLHNRTFYLSKRNMGEVHNLIRGKQMGDVLVDTLKIMADESSLIYPRNKSGTLDKRRIANAGYGDMDIFNQSIIEHYKPVLLHLSLDASTSMMGEKWKQSILLAVALARAAQKIKTLDVVISARSFDKIPLITIVHDSRVDTFEDVMTFFPMLTPFGGTPEGLAFETLKLDMMNSDPHCQKFFVNLSDGMPDALYGPMNAEYKGERAYRHTAQQINDLRNAGIVVLSYFIDTPNVGTNLHRAFITMYGRSARFINPSSIHDISRTLNSMFLEHN